MCAYVKNMGEVTKYCYFAYYKNSFTSIHFSVQAGKCIFPGYCHLTWKSGHRFSCQSFECYLNSLNISWLHELQEESVLIMQPKTHSENSHIYN